MSGWAVAVVFAGMSVVLNTFCPAAVVVVSGDAVVISVSVPSAHRTQTAVIHNVTVT